MILTDVSDTIHADSLALFALNIEILLADVTKPPLTFRTFTLRLSTSYTLEPFSLSFICKAPDSKPLPSL